MSAPIAGYEPLPFGLKHGFVASLSYVVLLVITGQQPSFGASTGVLDLYRIALTADIKLLVVTFVATVPVTMLLTRLYWEVRDRR